jgi:hypothetical protein
MSSCDFHIVLYLYSGIRCHSHTPVWLSCYESSVRPCMPTLIAASCRLYLRHHCRLNSSSHRTTCGIITVLIDLYSGIIATSTLMWYYTAREAVWDQTCLGCGIIADLVFIIVQSLPLPHFCGIMLLLVAVWDQTWSLLRHLADLDCPLVGQLAASLPTCG